ncbi:MAG: PAS domain S-box protein [Ignavibacteria bacterium]|nr:PAS domain S-box protein [Ignavibacteria bacterium]
MHIKFLLLDDVDSDRKLVKYEIQNYFKDAEIYEATNRKEFILSLTKYKPDIVISDYHLPDFDGLSALSLTHEMYPDLPFIILTGSASEEFGILCIKHGAYDYILKKHLKKLPIAIEEALKKYQLILENKEAYERLRENEKKFRLLVENAQDLIYRYEFHPKRGFTYVSPSATKITGYTPEDHYADPDLGFKIVYPDDRIILEKVAKGEFSITEPIILRWIRKDGTVIWTEQRNVPIFDDNGNLIAIEGIARDITNRKRLEAQLAENQKLLQLISNLITDYAYTFNVDNNGNMTGEWLSESFSKVFGWKLDEVKQMGGWVKCFHPDDLPKVFEHAKKVLSGLSDKIECRMVTKNGEIRWIRDYAVPLIDNKTNRVVKIFGVAEDITEQKKLENEIKEKEEFFEKLAESTTTAIFVYQGEKFVYANKASELISGYDISELLNKNFYEIVHPDHQNLVKERGLKRQKGEPVPTNYQFKIITKNGEEKWIDFTGNLINWKGKPAAIATAYDITPLKKAILNLNKLNESFLIFFENAPIGILVEDENGNILAINKKYEEISGYKREELLGKNISILSVPENLKFVKENIQKILNGEVLNHTIKSKRKDGSENVVHLIETAITLPNEKRGILSFCEDVTDKFNLQNQLIESEKKFRTIFETAVEGICIVNPEDLITDVNQRFCEIVGYEKDELLNQNFIIKLVHPDEKQHAIQEKLNRLKDKSQIFDRRLIKKDGSIIWTRVSAKAIFDDLGNLIGSFAFFTDITEQKRLQEELQKSEEQFRLIWENSQDGMRLTDEHGTVILVNPAYCKMVFLPKEKIEGRSLADIYLSKNKLEIIEKHKSRFITGNIKPHFETEVTLHNGQKVWFEVTNSFIHIGTKKYLLGIFRDITERKRLQKELISSEKQFRMIWEKSNDAMILTNKNGEIKLANPALCQLTGLSLDELINKPLDVIFHPIIRDSLHSLHQQKFEKEKFENKFEGTARLQNNKEIYFEASLSKIEIGNETLFLAIIRDITERKKLIDELIRAKEEAEEANRLKSGFISMMSHEIRTPLNVILGFTNVLKEIYLSDLEDEDIPKYFEAIDNAGKRLLNTITQILDISRIEAGEFEINYKSIDINKKVSDVVQQLKVLANKKKIEFNIYLEPHQPTLVLDEYCIDGILINLVNNAIKFSPENSNIDIKTELKEDKVIFKIRDFGIGMTEEYQKHLFQPFSQEKVGYSRPYEGTGLGLALTKKFVELMNGEIQVWSKKGEGTEFIVSFPLKI